MKGLKKILMAAGFAIIMPACAGRELHTRVPTLDWSSAERIADDIDDRGVLDDGYQTVGYLAGDASRCRIEPCYDIVAERVDITGDEEVDYVRVTIDTRLVNPEIYFHGPRFRVRMLFHVRNSDEDVENMDYAWVDDEGGNPGYDGRYDRDEPVEIGLEEYIRDVLRSQLENQQR